MLAKFGPCWPGVFVFLIPAPALACDHKLPNTSCPFAGFAAAGLPPPKEVLDGREDFDCPPMPMEEGWDAGVGAIGTEVK